MLTVLLSRRWLAALAAAIAFAGACFFLGRWQWGRYERSHALGHRITSHYSASPVPLRSVLSPGELMPLEKEWIKVEVTGRYDAAGQLLVRNRPNQSTYGYEVLVPLEVTSGGASGSPAASSVGALSLLVDRGWVANARTAAQRPTVPPVPSGTVTVTGWLRKGEPDVHRPPRAGELSSIDLTQAAASTQRRLYGAYAVLASERTASGAIPARPTPLDRPTAATDEGIHLSYAVQWWLGMSAGFGLVFKGVRRDVLDAAYARSIGLSPPAPVGRDAPDAEPVLVPSRPRKHRIWDDEDE